VSVLAAGSSVAGNDSSADVLLAVKNLFHVPDIPAGGTTTLFVVPQSGSVFVPFGVTSISGLPKTPFGGAPMLPPATPMGTWLHIGPGATTTFVNLTTMTGVGGSGIYALPANASMPPGLIGLGVTHVPEPSAFLCVGVVCGGLGLLFRWKRIKAA
jgi:hypothetical protein